MHFCIFFLNEYLALMIIYWVLHCSEFQLKRGKKSEIHSSYTGHFFFGILCVCIARAHRKNMHMNSMWAAAAWFSRCAFHRSDALRRHNQMDKSENRKTSCESNEKINVDPTSVGKTGGLMSYQMIIVFDAYYGISGAQHRSKQHTMHTHKQSQTKRNTIICL